MSRLRLAEVYQNAVDEILVDDLDDPVALIERTGLDKRTFFENSYFSDLDFRRSELTGVSFSGTRLERIKLYSDQEKQILSTGARIGQRTIYRRGKPELNTQALSRAKELISEFVEFIAVLKSSERMSNSLAKVLSDELDPSLSDIEILAFLMQSKNLDLSGTQVSDLAPISKLTNLVELDLSATRVRDISPLAHLTGLRKLNLGFTGIVDLSPLIALAQLEELSLSESYVTDISPLANLTNLKTLDLYKTNVADVSALVGLNNLKGLNLSRTKVSDAGPLAGLTKLSKLSLRHSRVSSIEPLVHLTNLSSLDLAGTPVADSKSLDRLDKLSVTIDLNKTETNSISTYGGEDFDKGSLIRSFGNSIAKDIFLGHLEKSEKWPGAEDALLDLRLLDAASNEKAILAVFTKRVEIGEETEDGKPFEISSSPNAGSKYRINFYWKNYGIEQVSISL